MGIKISILILSLLLGCGFPIPNRVYWALEESDQYVVATKAFKEVYGECTKNIYIHPMPTWFACPLSGREGDGCVGINDGSCIIYVGISKLMKNAECENVRVYLHELYHCCMEEYSEGSWTKDINLLSKELCFT